MPLATVTYSIRSGPSIGRAMLGPDEQKRPDRDAGRGVMWACVARPDGDNSPSRTPTPLPVRSACLALPLDLDHVAKVNHSDGVAAHAQLPSTKVGKALVFPRATIEAIAARRSSDDS